MRPEGLDLLAAESANVVCSDADGPSNESASEYIAAGRIRDDRTGSCTGKAALKIGVETAGKADDRDGGKREALVWAKELASRRRS